MRLLGKVTTAVFSTLFLLGFEASASTSFGDYHQSCDRGILGVVGKHFSIDNFDYPTSGRAPSTENGGIVFLSVCQPLLNNKSQIVATFGIAGDSLDSQRLLVVLIDAKLGRVIASRKEDVVGGAFTSATSLSIDSQRYRLSKTNKTFAVRLGVESGTSCRDEISTKGELRLFAIEANEIKQVLIQTIEFSRHLKADRCNGEASGEITTHVIARPISKSSNGFASLQLIAKRSDLKEPLVMKVGYAGMGYDLDKWSAALDNFRNLK
jgi:hypothetical protein